ncbi:MAG: hypothetical protein OQK12_08120, partial [Motiliproteus sp.]|nr:hypothetical protein [Motiliproteus sp.]
MIKRLAITLFLLMLVALVGAYLATPQLLSWYVQRIIDDSQCQHASAEFGHPDWNHWQIDNLRLEGCSQQPFTSLQIGQLQLHYDAAQVFREQRIHTLKVQGLELELASPANRPQNSTPHSPPKSPPKSPPLLSYWLAQLPLTDADIEIKKLSLTAFDHRWQITGKLKADNQKLESQLTASSGKTPPLSVEISADASDRILAKLNTPDQLLYQLDASLSLDEGKLAIHAQDHLNTEPTLIYIRDMGLLTDPIIALLDNYQTEAVIENQWRIQQPISSLLKGTTENLTVEQQMALQLDARSESQAIKQLSGEITAQLKWQPDQLNWQLLDSSQLALQLDDALLPHPELSDQWTLTPGQLSGVLNWKPQLRLSSDQGRLNLQSSSDNKLRLTSNLHRFGWQPQRSYGQFDSKIDKDRLSLESMTLQQVESGSRGQFALKGNNLSLNLAPGSFISANQLQHQKSTIDQLNMVVNHALQLQYQLEQKRWQSGPVELNLASANIKHPSFSSRGLSGQLSFNLDDTEPVKRKDAAATIAGDINLTLFDPQPASLRLPDFNLAGPYQLIYPNFSFQQTARLDQIKLSVQGKTNLKTQVLKADWSLPNTDLAALWALVPDKTQQQFPDLKIHQGNIIANGNFSKKSGAGSGQFEGDAEVKALQLQQGNWMLSGGRSLVQFNHSNHGDQQGLNAQGGFWADRISGALEFDTLSSGFSLSLLKRVLYLFYLHHASLRALGGNLAIAPVSL